MPNYPTSKDSLSNPAATDPLNAPSHSAQHGTANDILELLEDRVGYGSTTPTAGTLFSGTGLGTSDWQAPATAGIATSADLTSHAGAADPHSGYRLESADHTHATSGLQGGQVAHSALSGIAATDHHAAAAAGPDADVTVDGTGASGTAGTFGRSGHGHQLVTYAIAAAALAAVASAGTVATAPSRGDHAHAGAHSVLTGITATDHHAAPTAGPDANITVDAAGAAGTASSFARSAHGHQVATTAGPGGNITLDAAGAAGATGAVARASHGHQLVTATVPGGDINIDAAGDVGTAGAVARSLHSHQLVTYASTPQTATATAASAGTVGAAPSRGDHRHAGHNQSHDHSVSGDNTALNPATLAVAGKAVVPCVVAADSANATTTFANIPGLTFPVVAGTTYAWSMTLGYTVSVATIGIAIAFNHPGGSFRQMCEIFSPSTTIAFQDWQTASDTSVGTTSTSSTSQFGIRISGRLTATVSGTAAIRFKASAAGTVTIIAGSGGMVVSS